MASNEKAPSVADLQAAGLSDEQIASVLSKLGLGAAGVRGQGSVEPSSADVTPTPSFVIKTHVESTTAPKAPHPVTVAPLCTAGTKLFINLCYHEAMPPMRRLSRPGPSGEAEEGVHVPLAVGHLKEERDNKDAPCLVCDLIMHPDVIRDCDRDGSGGFRHWLVQLALQYVQMKHGLQGSAQYAIPKLKYKGSAVSGQRIRVDKPIGIQEVRDSSPLAPTSTPLGLLSEAGALPEGSTALAPHQPGMRGAALSITGQVPARRAPLPSTTPMEIRLLSEEREAREGGVIGQMAREAQQGVTAGTAGVTAEVQPAIVSAANKDTPDLLPVSSTRTLPKVRQVTVTAEVRVPQAEEQGQDEDGGVITVPRPPMVLLCPVHTSMDEKGACTVHVMAPVLQQTGATLPATCTLALTLTLGADQRGREKPAGVSIAGKGDGMGLVVQLPGYAKTLVRVPFTCTFVHGGEDGGEGRAAAVQAHWQAEEGSISVELPRRESVNRLPPLPTTVPSLQDPSFLSLLAQYVEADATQFDPDPGSRPWLLAQALADEAGNSPARTDRRSAAVQQGNVSASVPSSGEREGGGEELPEDSFLRQDALSLHFLQQREAEKAARAAKDAARADEPLVKEVTYEPGQGTVERSIDVKELQGKGQGRAAAQVEALLEDLV